MDCPAEGRVEEIMDLLSFELPFPRPTPLDPPSEYAQLRQTSPVIRTMTGAGTPAWLVIGTKEAQSVLSDRRFAITREDDPPDVESLLNDGENHARLRRVMAHGFSARTLNALKLNVDRIAEELVAQMRAAGPPADMMQALANPLVLEVITQMLGVPVQDRERFYKWSAAVSVVIIDEAAGLEQGWGELLEFLSGLVQSRREEPQDDLLSVLIAVRDAEDGRLNDSELLKTAAGLLTGGHVTTVNTITTGVMKLIESGGGLGGLADEHKLELAVEEVFRHQAGISGEAFPRFACADVEVGGQHIAKGDIVIVRLEGVNRDPVVFDDPDRFDTTRTPNPHLRFGYGPHRCVGAAVARMTVTAAFRALANQLPMLAMTVASDEVPWTGRPLDNGPSELIVTW
jgi:cytochrome P450